MRMAASSNIDDHDSLNEYGAVNDITMASTLLDSRRPVLFRAPHRT